MSEFLELRKWIREDIAKLHDKLDRHEDKEDRKWEQYLLQNASEHKDIQKQLEAIDKKAEVNKTKIGSMVAGITFALTAFINFIIRQI